MKLWLDASLGVGMGNYKEIGQTRKKPAPLVLVLSRVVVNCSLAPLYACDFLVSSLQTASVGMFFCECIVHV